ncbi:MAG: NAD-dependent malic enzyme [Sandaracinaceae bacterium]|nr:NAD-dependent malic enzyme [Sandaracinaceae bacterium]
MARYELAIGEDGKPEVHVPHRGHRLLENNIYNHGTAFTLEQREALGLAGMLPAAVRTLEHQVQRAYGHVTANEHPLARYLALADLESRNATLYYRLIVEHLEEFLPIVYTPTVGRACQKYSHLFRRGRGLWITPNHRGRIAAVLRNAPYEDVRLICVTDNERILGLGDQGAGGMGIPVGKLDLYVVGAGIHPTQTLPISFDVGTDNQELLDDPFYIGWRGKRLRGEAYDELVEELVTGIQEVFPKALLQWEDFKKANAFDLLDRYDERILSFNDDIQGTAGIALAGVVAASRISGTPMEQQRIVMLGAGAAGIGIARILAAELDQLGLTEEQAKRSVAILDSEGLLVDNRSYRDAYKTKFAWPAAWARDLGLDPDQPIDLLDIVKAMKPTVLIGTSGVPNTFSEAAVREMARHCERPAIFPFSNPNSKAEALPSDLVEWTEGRALIASGSPFDPVAYHDKTIDIAQGNNVYVFPGVGLGALVSGATKIVDSMFAAAAHAIGAQLGDDDVAAGRLYPPLSDLRSISRAVAIEVGQHAMKLGLAPRVDAAEFEARVDAAMWFPEYARIKL